MARQASAWQTLRAANRFCDESIKGEFLKRWTELDTFGQRMEKNAGNPTFVLHDGPPYANGDLHRGAQQDAPRCSLRYVRMKVMTQTTDRDDCPVSRSAGGR